MREFFENIKVELNKITWPTDKELKIGIRQVFVFMAIFIAFFAAVDGVISFGLAAATSPAPIVAEVDEADTDGQDNNDVDAADEEDSTDE